MSDSLGFSQFVALDERDVPELLVRMSKHDLHVDGERYGVFTRLIAKTEATPADLGVAVLKKLLQACGLSAKGLGAVVFSSRTIGVQDLAEEIVHRVGADCQGHGLERACSGFPAATALGITLCRELNLPVAIIAAEIISPSINWEPGGGDLEDHRRARGQAAKLFGDGAAAVLILPAGQAHAFEILDAWSGEVPDDKQLIQKTAVEHAVDPWGHVRPGLTDCMSMPGRRGFLLVLRAPRLLAEALGKSIQRASSMLGDGAKTASHVVPHQANGLILSRLENILSESGGKPHVWDCIRNMGNTVSASIPLAMSQVQDKLPGGALVGMPSVGAGGPGYRPEVLSTGCVLIRTVERSDESPGM